MEHMMHIGAKIDKEQAENLTDSIIKIFEAAHQNRVADNNLHKALDILSTVFETKNITVSGCTFTNDDSTHIETDNVDVHSDSVSFKTPPSPFEYSKFGYSKDD